MQCIGEEISEKLDFEPVKFLVRRTIRSKYACRGCETITTAPTLPAIIDRGIAAPEVASGLQKGVICLLTALRFHGLMMRSPFQVWLAIGNKSIAPLL